VNDELFASSSTLDVYSEQDLDESVTFWKKTTKLFFGDFAVTARRSMTADRIHQVPHGNHMGCSRPLGPSRLNRDCSRGAAVATGGA